MVNKIYAEFYSYSTMSWNFVSCQNKITNCA